MKAWKLGAIAPLAAATLFFGAGPARAVEPQFYERQDNFTFPDGSTTCTTVAAIRLNEHGRLQISSLIDDAEPACFHEVLSLITWRFRDTDGDVQTGAVSTGPDVQLFFYNVSGDIQSTQGYHFQACGDRCESPTYVLPESK